MYLCIDIGGTKTLVALFNSLGLKTKESKFPTDQDPIAFAGHLQAAILKVLPEEKDRSAVKMTVIAYPGIVQNGQPLSAPNLSSWKNFDIVACIKNLFISNRFTCPFYFENDANLAAFYECHGLKGKNIYLTFSTGIGGGIVKDDVLLPESVTFEPGRALYTYNGQQATWEQFASTSAINTAHDVDDIKKLAEDKRALFDIASRLSLGIAHIIREEQPVRIIIGGPIALVWSGFDNHLKTILAPSQNPTAPTKIVRAKKPMECVEYGCYLFARATEKATKA